MAFVGSIIAAPSSPNGTLPFTVTEVNNLATMTLAPQGTPLWHAQKDDFAPRLGVAWQARPNWSFGAARAFSTTSDIVRLRMGSAAWPYVQQSLFNFIPAERRRAAPPPFSTTLRPA